MRTRLKQKLKVAGACLACLAAGTFIGPRLLRPQAPQAVVPPPGLAAGAATDAGVEAALDRVIPEIDLEAVRFDEAVARLGRLGGVPILVEWETLEEGGIQAQSPITFRARNATLGRALTWICQTVSDRSRTDAAYAAVGGTLVLSTGEALAPRTLSVRTYDVQDLIDRAARDPWRSWPPSAIVELPVAPPPPGSVPSPADELLRIVQDSTPRDSWRVDGGFFGSADVLAGRLVVTQTWQGHRDVAAVLERLRHPEPPPPPPAPGPELMVWNEQSKRYEPEQSEAAEAALDQRRADVRLDAVPFEDAASALARQWHTNIYGNWSAIHSAGIGRLAPVSLHLSDVTLAEALRALFAAVGGSDQLAFVPDGNCITLSTRRELRDNRLIRVYDVRDWIESAAGPPPPAGSPRRATWDASKDAAVASLIAALQGTVDPGSWRDAGGAFATVKETNGRLIVAQTWENYRQVAALLAALQADPARLRAALTTQPAPAAAPSNGRNP